MSENKPVSWHTTIFMVIGAFVLGSVIWYVINGILIPSIPISASDNFLQISEHYKNEGTETTDDYDGFYFWMNNTKSYHIFQYCGFTDSEIQEDLEKLPDYYRIIRNETTGMNDIKCGQGNENYHYGIRSYIAEVDTE